MIRLTAALSLAALLAALATTPETMAQETIYKWTDAEGTVHYTARPPEGVEYEVVDVDKQVQRSAAEQASITTVHASTDTASRAAATALNAASRRAATSRT